MAVVKNNRIMYGASGSMGDEFVIRQRGDKMVYCKFPCEYPPSTDKQIANQQRFKRANDFAKAAVKDPAKKEYYKSIAKPNQTAFNAAFQDAYHKPEVEVKEEAEKIIIKVKAKHPILKVLVGKQPATLKNKHWEYKHIQKPFTVTVYDVAGNICTKEMKI